MRKLRAQYTRFIDLFFSRRREEELSAELESHLQLHIDDNIRAGMTLAQARRNALMKLGGIGQTKQAYRERATLPQLDNLTRDLSHALRQLRRAPAFAMTVVLTLALGIGANTAIYSVVNAVLKHPAGVDHPERVAVLKTRYTQFNLDIPFVSVPVYAWAASLPQVEAAAVESGASFNILHDGSAEHIPAARVSSKWFQVFGAQPILGRTIAPEEDQPSAGTVVVLSYGIWQNVFGGQRDVIGKTMLLDDKPYHIIGVMRSDFAWPRGSRIWVPIALPPSAFDPNQGFNENYQSVVRLRPGVALNHFNAELSTKMWEEIRRLAGAPYATKSGWAVYSTPWTAYAAGSLERPLYVLLGVVVLVLFIASANVAGLFLARASARTREFAIRTSLGASASRMMQQMLVETALLSCLAAGIGIAAGPALGRLLLLLVPHSLAEGFTVHMDGAVLVFTAGTALVTSLIAGLGPVFRLLRQRKGLQLHDSTRSATASIEKQRLRSAFVITEVSLAYLLLAGTGLFLTSLARLQQVDPGFNPHGVIAAKVDYAGEDFKKNQARQAAFVGTTVTQLAAAPGVTAAAAIDTLPFDPLGMGSSSFRIEGRSAGPNDPGPHSQINYATPGYLKVMQIPLVRGRWFTEDDRKGTAPVVVVDERLAHKYWPNQEAVGQHMSSGGAEEWATVIGVVRNVRGNSLEDDTADGMRYYSFAQVDNATASFVVRASGNPMRLAATLKEAVSAADTTQAVSAITTEETLVADSLAGRRLIVWMLAAFAGLALLLSVIGIYALISYVTAQRTSEIGIRMALGAQRSGVLRLVLSNALGWVAAGLLLGLALSVFAAAVLTHFFATFGGGILSSLGTGACIILAAGLLAGLIPALRAASIEPGIALRAE
jgi:predicted permease